MTNKLLFVTFFNCHGKEYTHQLKNNTEFNNKYNVINIALTDYLNEHQYESCNDLIESHSDIMKNADVLLIQNLKNNRGFLTTNSLIGKYCKNTCIIIKIPHYTFSGYEYVYDVLQDPHMSFDKTNKEILIHLNTLYKDDEDQIKEFLEQEFQNLSELDKMSDITVCDFTKSIFNTSRLFHARKYPTYVFFYEASKQLLNILNIQTTSSVTYTGNFKYLEIPILPNVVKFLNIKFPPYAVNKTINMIDCFLAIKQLIESKAINKDIFYANGRIDKDKFHTIQQIHNERIHLQLS